MAGKKYGVHAIFDFAISVDLIDLLQIIDERRPAHIFLVIKRPMTWQRSNGVLDLLSLYEKLGIFKKVEPTGVIPMKVGEQNRLDIIRREAVGS